MYRYTTFALASLFPVGLCSFDRLRLNKLRVKPAEKLGVHILVISIVIPAAQSEDAYSLCNRPRLRRSERIVASSWSI